MIRQLSQESLERTRDATLALCLVVAAVANFVAHRQFYFEDAFITFRYAENIAQGMGMVFNPGERVLGASSALYTLLLATLAWIGFDVVAAGGLVYTTCLSATGYIVARHLKRLGYPNAGVAFALMAAWGVGGTLRFFGMETALYMLLIAASVSQAAAVTPSAREDGASPSHSPWGLGILLGLTCLTRYDGTVVAFVIGLYLWARRRRPPWSEAFIASALFGTWLLFAWFYFGSPLPNTLGAKAGDSGVVAYLGSAWSDLRTSLFSPFEYRGVSLSWRWRFPLLGLLFLPTAISGWRMLSRRKSLWMWLGVTVLLLTGYAVIGPPKQHYWYQMPSLYCLLAFLLAGWGEALRAVPRRWAAAMALAGLVASLVAIPWSVPRESAFHERTGPPGRISSYAQFADWIIERQLTDTTILTHEPGFLTFHTGQRAIDAAGLVSKDIYFHGPKQRRSGLFQLIERFDPDFMVLKQDAPGVLQLLENEYLKVSNGMPDLTLFMRRPLYEAMADDLQKPWAQPDVVGEGPSVTDAASENGLANNSWQTKGTPFDTGPGIGVAWSAPSVIDFDELSFDFTANSPQTRLQLLVDDAIVWQLDHRGRSDASASQRLAVYPWKGRDLRLRLWDGDDRDGALRISNLQIHRYASQSWLEDFEEPEGRDFWRPVEGEDEDEDEDEGFSLIVRNDNFGKRFGFQQTQGYFVSSTLGAEEPLRRFSQPFTLSEDRLQMMVYDLGGASTSVSLWVDGERARHFKGTASGQLRMVRWGVKTWRGREAVLQLRDDDGEPRQGLAIDGLLLYSY